MLAPSLGMGNCFNSESTALTIERYGPTALAGQGLTTRPEDSDG